MDENKIKTRKLIRRCAAFLYCFAKIWSLSSDCEKCLATLSPLESNDHLQPRLQFDGQTIACASETGILLWDFKTLQMTRYVSQNKTQPFLRGPLRTPSSRINCASCFPEKCYAVHQPADKALHVIANRHYCSLLNLLYQSLRHLSAGKFEILRLLSPPSFSLVYGVNSKDIRDVTYCQPENRWLVKQRVSLFNVFSSEITKPMFVNKYLCYKHVVMRLCDKLITDPLLHLCFKFLCWIHNLSSFS